MSLWYLEDLWCEEKALGFADLMKGAHRQEAEKVFVDAV
jgi:hypothetical protein